MLTWILCGCTILNMNNEKALNAYIKKTERARELARRILAGLDDHIGDNPDAINWAHVGDANHVVESLSEISGFMGVAE